MRSTLPSRTSNDVEEPLVHGHAAARAATMNGQAGDVHAAVAGFDEIVDVDLANTSQASSQRSFHCTSASWPRTLSSSSIGS